MASISSSSKFSDSDEAPVLQRDLDILNRCILQQQKSLDDKSADCAVRIKCLRNHKLQQVLEEDDSESEENDENELNFEEDISYCIRRAEILCEHINWKLSNLDLIAE